MITEAASLSPANPRLGAIGGLMLAYPGQVVEQHPHATEGNEN